MSRLAIIAAILFLTVLFYKLSATNNKIVVVEESNVRPKFEKANECHTE